MQSRLRWLKPCLDLVRAGPSPVCPSGVSPGNLFSQWQALKSQVLSPLPKDVSAFQPFAAIFGFPSLLPWAQAAIRNRHLLQGKLDTGNCATSLRLLASWPTWQLVCCCRSPSPVTLRQLLVATFCQALEQDTSKWPNRKKCCEYRTHLYASLILLGFCFLNSWLS